MSITPRHSLDLYPPVESPANPPTWEDFERLAMSDPAAHHALTMVYRGDWTREQALIVLAFANYDVRRRSHHEAVDRLNCTIPNYIVLQG